MKKRELVSAYTRKKYRVHAVRSNEAAVPNLLDRDFNNQAPGACVVSDLTYVWVGMRWAYICILLELGARDIIGHSAGAYKNADLVHKAFSTVKGSLFGIQMFHTDRGSEFDNALIDDLLESSQINRSLSMKGCPYDNAVAESTFKMIKAKFVSCRRFDTLDQLQPGTGGLCALVQQHSAAWHAGIPVTGGVQENLYLIISVRFGVDNPSELVNVHIMA